MQFTAVHSVAQIEILQIVVDIWIVQKVTLFGINQNLAPFRIVRLVAS
jgi:hypothetical protein